MPITETDIKNRIPSPSKTIDTYPAQKPRILIVEDDVKLRDVLIEAITEEKGDFYQILEPSDGTYAEKRIKAGTADLVILDWHLNDTDRFLDGTKLVATTMQMEEAKKPALLMMTAYNPGQLVNELAALNIHGSLTPKDYFLQWAKGYEPRVPILTKPFDVNRLMWYVDYLVLARSNSHINGQIPTA